MKEKVSINNGGGGNWGGSYGGDIDQIVFRHFCCVGWSYIRMCRVETGESVRENRRFACLKVMCRATLLLILVSGFVSDSIFTLVARKNHETTKDKMYRQVLDGRKR